MKLSFEQIKSFTKGAVRVEQREDYVNFFRFTEKQLDGTEQLLGTVPLYAAYSVPAVTYKRGLWDWIRSLFGT